MAERLRRERRLPGLNPCTYSFTVTAVLTPAASVVASLLAQTAVSVTVP